MSNRLRMKRLVHGRHTEWASCIDQLAGENATRRVDCDLIAGLLIAREAVVHSEIRGVEQSAQWIWVGQTIKRR